MMKDEPDETPEQYADRRELVGILEAAVDQLPEIYRVFMMREVEQLSTSECADVLELSEEARRALRSYRRRGHGQAVAPRLPD